MKTLSQVDFLAECAKRFGPKPRQWKFVCPACGTVQSIQQLFDAGLSQDEVHGAMAFSCIGRFTGQDDAGIAAKQRGEKWDKGCNWTLGGLFQIHTLEVDIGGCKRPAFEIAPINEVAP